MENIKGKVVIITGASSGIGEATARLLAENGAKVVLAARREDRLHAIVNDIKQNGGEAVSVKANVVSADDMKSLAQFALDKYGRIDVLVNNAGIMPSSRMNELRVEEWEQMIDVNIKGVLYAIAAVLPIMREQKSGHVINLSSTSGYHVSATSAIYAATKFAVRAISEGLRLEESASSGIRSTVVAPGLTSTELFGSITSPEVQAVASQIRDMGIAPSRIAKAIAYAISEPDDALISEIMVRPTALA
ncbi:MULTISPECIES: SDR family oxidoreductase [unclassified Paenibacillus]|uniref:SDR family oxidoreductase n=1 Tax=unclassified Paenibacillus TaxID=185978 RepID=UPI00104C34F6|nr:MULTISPECIES: SDR family oxidoreductase [unclassified Paenibacillus]NIK71836.1 NADP-dependent 3-hydroxy acid dehydrogenase YdfG [Paenibacillus sp. BK720]TCM96488.1 NADP-dependent 3-hydroxy acid dehydrogenase YdfG [Paenibacillus sp. BK033]